MDKKISIFVFVFAFLAFASLVSGAYSSSYMNQPPNYQAYYSSSAGENLGSRLSTYWAALDDPEQCRARQDVVLQVAPAGCSPSVVRSDLLAEQNVPVFCQVNALQLNPLIEINQISNIRFSGNKYPEGVVGAGFHPIRAELKSRSALMGSPLLNNIGYVVVVLKKNVNESSLPEYVNMTLKGVLEYDSGNAFGIGRYEFILNEQSDAEWDFTKNKQSFFRGNYFLRLERAEPEYALVSVYQGDRKLYTIRIEKGKTSNDIYLPGFYCQAALKFEYAGYEAAQKSARIEVSDSKGTETFDVYERSSFLDGKCSVREIKINGKGENGNVTIACDGNNRIVLEMKPRGAEFAVGEIVNYYSDLTKTSEKDAKRAQIINISESNIYTIEVDGRNIDVLSLYLKSIDPKNSKITFKDIKYSNETDDLFNNAIAEYERVADEFPAEKINLDDKNSLTYAEESLSKAKDLAKDFGKTQTRYRLLNRLIEEYPESPRINEYRNELSYLSIYDTGYSETLALINNDYKTIRLVSLSLPEKASSLTFALANKASSTSNTFSGNALGDTTITSGSYTSVSGVNGLSAQIDKIDGDRATILFNCPIDPKVKTSTSATPRSVTIYTNKYDYQSVSICGVNYLITYRDSNIERVARIKISPKSVDTRTETNLSVAIGIEKRAIKLNPQKTVERINNINESIKKWESISNGLGKAVTGLKAACFATTAALTVKNFFTGLDGTALARQKVMQDLGWSEKCRIAYQDKKPLYPGQSEYKSIDDCIFQNKDKIDAQIEVAKNTIAKDNSDIERIISQAGNTREGGIFSGKQVIYDNVAAGYLKDKSSVIKGALGINNLSANDNSSLTYERAKEVVFYDSLLKSGTLDEASKNKINEKLKQYNQTFNENRERDRVFSEVISKSSALQNEFVNVYIDKERAQKGYWTGKTFGQLGFNEWEGLNSDSKMALTVIEGKTYAFKLGDQPSISGSDYYPSSDVYELGKDGKTLTKIEGADRSKLMNLFPQFEKVSEANYRNVYQGAEIRYFETDPYKGVPEVVPIDLREGWYAGIRNDLPLMGAKANVDASGAVASFWLCNVGKDGREEFRKDGFGNDICKRFDFYTGQALDDFPGISDRNKVKRLVTTAVSSIREAQQQYKNGLATGKTVRINGENIKVGNPALTVTGSNCQDFMSASDCQILFNVCDPVICPNTRCNLGGQFYVQDVVQSGIVGSALLCLPNFGNPADGGVAIPVCLSGLKAGVDGFVSIMKSHRDCLQKNIETGEMVGICDQIYSIYLCDFFWKQIAPAVNVLLPKLIEFAANGGKKARGGGEYMTVMFAWENAQKSVDYFTQSYAANSFKAFNLRSTQDVGDQFCKAFVSTKVPTNIKSLVSPDSPVQFYAYFDSSTLNTATVPATAQYKVYYHIFAGNDFGAYYSVYLKDAPQTSYYVANPTIPVASGFLPKGESADETRDFSAPEGYKQLCVRINDEEKCGFKQVTTDFGLNYLNNKVVANEITEKSISSESECISGGGLANGGISATSLLNPNLQGIAEGATDAKIYERGIVRVCATENPASSTNPSRYVQVGSCDASGKVKCWLDKKSVDNALVEGDIGTRNKTLEELSTINQEYLGDKLVDSAKIQSRIKNISDRVIQLKKDIALGQGKYDVSKLKSVLIEIDNIVLNGDESGVISNAEKAKLLQMKGEIRDGVARNYLKSVADANKVSLSGGKTTTPTTPPTTTPNTLSLQEKINNALMTNQGNTATTVGAICSFIGFGSLTAGEVAYAGAFVSSSDVIPQAAAYQISELSLASGSSANVLDDTGKSIGSLITEGDSLFFKPNTGEKIAVSLQKDGSIVKSIGFGTEKIGNLAKGSKVIAKLTNGLTKAGTFMEEIVIMAGPKAAILLEKTSSAFAYFSKFGTSAAGKTILSAVTVASTACDIYVLYVSISQWEIAADQMVESAERADTQLADTISFMYDKLEDVDDGVKIIKENQPNEEEEKLIIKIDSIKSQIREVNALYAEYNTNDEKQSTGWIPFVPTTTGSSFTDAEYSIIRTKLQNIRQELQVLIREFEIYNFGSSNYNVGLDNNAYEVFTLDSAIAKLSDPKFDLNTKYSENKQFIDQLYFLGIIVEEEYDEINGGGWFDTEENMLYVKNLLLAKQRIADGKTSTITINDLNNEGITIENNYLYLDGEIMGIINPNTKTISIPSLGLKKCTENNILEFCNSLVGKTLNNDGTIK